MKNGLFLSLIALTAIGCGGGGGDSSSTASSPPNLAPTISELSLAPIKERAEVSYTPSVTDSDGSIASYQWLQTSGTEVLELVSNTGTLSFTAPALTTSEVISFSLTVIDNDGASATRVMDIDVETYPELNTVSLADSGMQKCLTTVPEADVGISSLSCSDIVIKSLEDLVNFKNIKELTLVNTELKYITGLNNLKDLESFTLIGHDLWDFSSLTEYPNLTSITIDLASRYSHDLSYVTSLPNLRQLSISNTYLLKNISSLKEAVNLETLVLSDARLDSLSFLPSLEKLTSLDISGNEIDDITALSQLPNLKKLRLSSAKVSELESIFNLTKLEHLDLSDSHGYSYDVDLSGIDKLVNLKELILTKVQSYNIDDVATLTSLEKLDLTSGNLLAISPIEKLTALKTLDLSNNPAINDIYVLEKLVNLESLNLSGLKNINSLSNISSLKKLTSLNIDLVGRSLSNTLIDIAQIAPLTNLEVFSAELVNLGNARQIETLTKLKKLNLKNSQLDELFDFSDLTNLEELDITADQFTDLSVLDGLYNLKELTAESRNLASLGDFSTLPSLEKLSIISAPGVDDFSPLSSLKRITDLKLGGIADLGDLGYLSGLKTLIRLDLNGSSYYSNTAALLALENLHFLNLGHNRHFTCDDLQTLKDALPLALIRLNVRCSSQGVDFSLFTDPVLKNCIAAKYYDISKIEQIDCQSPVKNLEGLEQFTNVNWLTITTQGNVNLDPIVNLRSLNVLSLPFSNITSDSEFSKFHEHSNLSYVSLRGNKLTSVYQLNDIPNLRGIDLYGNYLEDVSSLNEIGPQLTTLLLQSNRLTDISNLSTFKSLEWLVLSGNEIVDVSVLSPLTNLSSIEFYYINSIDCDSLATLQVALPTTLLLGHGC